jgi:predicted site-specific integrase-resolvase
MSLAKTWYTLNEAASKFGVEKQQILKWVEEGLVRAETEQPDVIRVNADDLELEIGDRVQRG